jgi:probable F420-dependent oxidoreductase
MRVQLALPADDWAVTRRAARFAESLGYDSLVAVELAHDPFLPLAIATGETSQIGLATGIALAFPRSPTIVASSAWALQTQSRGRFCLGLGSQVRAHIERRFAATWSAPATRLREYVEALRAIWRCWEHGGPLRYEGEHYRLTLMTPEFSPKPTGLPPIPIHVAAVGPAMLRMAGRHCDGVRLHTFATRRYLEEVALPELARGLADSGRAREHFEVAGGGFAVTGPSEGALRAERERIRYRIGFYGSTPAYREVLSLHGWDELGERLHARSRRGEWDQLAAEVSDEVLHTFAAIAPYDRIAAAIGKRFAGVTDSVGLELPLDIDPGFARELVSEVRALPHSFRGVTPSP